MLKRILSFLLSVNLILCLFFVAAITVNAKMKSTSISKLTGGVKSITVEWKKQSKQITGYQLQYATNNKFTKGKKTITIKRKDVILKTVKNLKANKKYYVRVRTYKKGKNTNKYSSWSKVKSVKTKGKWYTLYKNFILRKKYLEEQTGIGRMSDSYDYNRELEEYANYTIVDFRLIDFNRDGVPELVANSGWTDFSYPLMFIYTVKKDKIVYLDKFYGSDSLGYTTNSKYKGVFYSGGRQGGYSTCYCNLVNNKAIRKNIALDEIKDFNDWSKGFNTTVYDEELYKIYLKSTKSSSNGAAFSRPLKKEIPYYNYIKIKSMGWYKFVKKYSY